MLFQAVSSRQPQHVNPRCHAQIQAFRARTSVPMVLNTSFNENEPVVCKPEEALDCFLRTKMDTLVIGHSFITRHGEAQPEPSSARKPNAHAGTRQPVK